MAERSEYAANQAGRIVRSTLTAVAPLALAALCLLAAPATSAEKRLQPQDFRYLGAFRLPDDGERPKTFSWGGNAMTYRPIGTRKPAADSLAGSLFVMGHDRMAYGELPDGNQIAEITIPQPVKARDPEALPKARFLQRFRNVAAGRFKGLDELPRSGMVYLDRPQTGPLIHLSWGQHLQPETSIPTHAWIEPDLSQPRFTGTWFIGRQSDYSVNGYMFEIPAAWAAKHLGGRTIATGRYRDGGWSGMGPSLIAYKPWTDEAGTPAPPGARLQEQPLLLYASSRTTNTIERALSGYQHPDEWEGGAWITTRSGKAAVVFVGTKAVGRKYWYGFVNPAGPQYPCVAAEFADDPNVCRHADGRPCPAADLKECQGHNGYRGWWTNRFEAQFILYDPADLARVAAGHMKPWEPQPYASITIDDRLFMNPGNVDPQTVGTGEQRRYRIGAAAFDREYGHFFVLELFAENDKPVVHVWKLQ